MLPLMFAVSFIIYPVFSMSSMYDEGAKEYKMAEQLKHMNIRGSFTAIVKPGTEAQRIERLAYFSENQLYSIAKKDVSQKALLLEMRKYHVNYCFFHEGEGTNNVFVDENGAAFPEITKGNIPGLKVFLVGQ